MNLDEAFAARERIEARVARLTPLTRAYEHDPYVCNNPLGFHFITDDNPMRTGRCLCCRRFCGRTRQGWRTCTTTQAAVWGLYEIGHHIVIRRRT
jgi:hypothetical protein